MVCEARVVYAKLVSDRSPDLIVRRPMRLDCTTRRHHRGAGGSGCRIRHEFIGPARLRGTNPLNIGVAFPAPWVHLVRVLTRAYARHTANAKPQSSRRLMLSESKAAVGD